MKKTERLQGKILELLQGNTSQKKLAKSLGVSDATLINIKGGRFDQVSESMISKLCAKLNINDWTILKTPNLVTIEKLCRDTQRKKRFVAIAAPTGLGKTTALKYYASKNGSMYVLATVIDTQKSFCEKLQKVMGINVGSTKQTMLQGIVDYLNRQDNPLLIIDDGGKLNERVMRLLQIIYDETEHHCGIVLAGTEYLKEMFDKLVRKNRLGFRELDRRISYWQPLRKPTARQVGIFCEENGIDDPNAIKFIAKESTNYGTLRNIITNATQMANEEQAAVTRELLANLNVGDYAYEGSF